MSTEAYIATALESDITEADVASTLLLMSESDVGGGRHYTNTSPIVDDTIVVESLMLKLAIIIFIGLSCQCHEDVGKESIKGKSK